MLDKARQRLPHGYVSLLIVIGVMLLLNSSSFTLNFDKESISFEQPRVLNSTALLISQQREAIPPVKNEQVISETNAQGTQSNELQVLKNASALVSSSFSSRSKAGDPSLLRWNFPVAERLLGGSKRAIFLLSMGPDAAKSILVERILISIRKRGLFLGPVIVLTDAPTSRYHSLTSLDPNFFVLQPLAKDWRWSLERDMPYKRFKTYILEYLELQPSLRNVQLVYYLDIDVVVGQPLQAWFDHVERTYVYNATVGSFPSKMVFFQGNYHWSPVQGGQFVLERNVSQPCLERWRHHIDSNPQEDKDQKALVRLFQEQEESIAVCRLAIMPQKPYLYFLSKNAMTRIMNSTNYYTLMHIKNTHHATKIPDKTQKKFFSGLLDLNSEEAELMGKVRIRPNKTWSSFRSEGDDVTESKASTP